MENQLLKKRWIYIMNGFIVLLFMGCSYAWSIFVLPLETTYGWLRSETSLAFTLNIVFFSVGSILTGMLSKKLSFSTLLKLSGLMIGSGFFLSSFVKDVWLIYFTYSFLCGAGIGMGYNCVVSSAPLWFPEKTGMVTGILLMGYALSTAILGPVINGCINIVGISTTFKILAIVCMLGLILGSILLKIPSIEQMGMLPQVDHNSHKKSYNLITSEMIKKPIFWIYFILSALLAGVGLSIINHASPLLTEEFFIDASLAAMVISINSISNGLGRFIWGILYDQLGLKKILSAISCLMFIAIAFILTSIMIKAPSLFILSSCLLMFSFGGNASVIPTIIRELFGHRTFSLNYSVLCINCLLSSLLPTIVGTLQTSSGHYTSPVILLFVVSIINIVLTIIMLKLYKKDYE